MLKIARPFLMEEWVVIKKEGGILSTVCTAP
jgi:hypothetical protein